MVRKGKSNLVRNEDGLWINVKPFKKSGETFFKRGYYIPDPKGSIGYTQFWKEEHKRFREGYSVGGVKITGDHYFYMNYAPIKKADIEGGTASKIVGMPDFWDGDYNYFIVREIARYGLPKKFFDKKTYSKWLKLKDEKKKLKFLEEEFDKLGLYVKIEPDYLTGGYNLIIGKSRRKGFSYKNSAIAVKNLITKPKSRTILAAYESKYLYPAGLFAMAYDTRNFINANTAFSSPADVVDKQASGHVKNSYIQYQDGVKVEKGFQSDIISYTLKDNPDVLRGKDGEDIFFEEAGAFGTPGLLKKGYSASKDTVMAGTIQTGLITIFGTSGDLDKGTVDYADMMMKPLAYKLLPFQNVWDGELDMKVGYFHPVNWNMEGFYDENGNSDIEGAKAYELANRELRKRHGATSIDIIGMKQERPLGPIEAFGNVSDNIFPILELNRQLRYLNSINFNSTRATPVEFLREKDGKVKAIPIFDDNIEPIQHLKNIPTNIRGVPIIFEAPKEGGVYYIGYDPVRQDEGSSLAAIIVYKAYRKGTGEKGEIVAEYYGRRDITDDMNRIAEFFADYYGAKVMFENNVKDVKTYFRKIRRLNLLALQPDNVISKHIKNSKVARGYGCHMDTQLKIAALTYIKDWLLSSRGIDDNGKEVLNLYSIKSTRLIEELINYNNTGNFDAISAFAMVMIQQQENILEIEGQNKKIDKQYEELRNIVKNLRQVKRRKIYI